MEFADFYLEENRISVVLVVDNVDTFYTKQLLRFPFTAINTNPRTNNLCNVYLKLLYSSSVTFSNHSTIPFCVLVFTAM
jgi:hypothetical protein